VTDQREAEVRRAFERYERYIHPSFARLIRLAGLETLAVEADGAVVRDIYGREYLDFAAGIAVFVLGHRHPAVVAAVERELHRLPLSPRVPLDGLAGELAELLAQVTPGDLQYTFFCHSGTEANEGALKLARLATGRPGFVAAEGAFHGKTFGSLSVSGRDVFRDPFRPLLPEVRHVPFGDLAALEAAVDGTTAAVILEPIQGENGIVVPPEGYLRGARAVCDRHGALLILDEVQTGMGHTGRLWACEWEGVTPDILTAAKGLGGGVAPLGAFIARPRAFDALARHPNPVLHSTTIMNRLAWAAAIATIRTIQAEGLLERALAIGERLLGGLREVQRRHPRLIREVRGRGALVGVEFVHSDVGLLVNMGLVERQVLGVFALNRQEVIRFAPPLIVTDAQVDRAVEAMEEACAAAEALLGEVLEGAAS